MSEMGEESAVGGAETDSLETLGEVVQSLAAVPSKARERILRAAKAFYFEPENPVEKVVPLLPMFLELYRELTKPPINPFGHDISIIGGIGPPPAAEKTPCPCAGTTTPYRTQVFEFFAGLSTEQRMALLEKLTDEQKNKLEDIVAMAYPGVSKDVAKAVP